MLVPSPRHTKADLELWSALAQADLSNAAAPAFQRRVRDAIAAMRCFLAAGPGVYAAVSWGKDSVTIAHLLWQVDRSVPLVHLRPTNHNPDCDLVRDRYFERWPGQPYHELRVDYSDLDRRALPPTDLDRLTDQRWYAAIREARRRFGPRHISGVRAAESPGRRIRVARWGLISPCACAPIGRWSTQDVFAYLAVHDLPVHPAYACLGGGRWPRDRVRVAEIGDTRGGGWRAQWEREYYGDLLRRSIAGRMPDGQP